ncbi:MAG TPA: hypothetical protein VKR53_03220 [Puia sp.]|nr:hypothetical protein [Puia sp.]
MDIQRETIRHLLASLAYRTQKAIRGAGADFPDFSAGHGVRTPIQLIRHMSDVIGYARTFFIGGIFRAEPLSSFAEEVERFHFLLGDLSAHLAAGTAIKEISLTQLMQGPVADAMTHAGQLALLRRLAGLPVPSENFIFAEISADNLGSNQPLPAAPDSILLGKIIHLSWRLRKFFKPTKPQ